MPNEWYGVKMVDGRVEELELHSLLLCAVPAEVWRLSVLEHLDLRYNQLTSVPAAICELRAAGCNVRMDNCLTVDE